MAIPAVALSVGDFLQERVGFWFAPQAAYNILYWEIASIVGGASVDLQALCNELDSLTKVPACDIITASASYSGVGLKRISPGVPSVEAVSTTGSGVGTWAGDAYAKQVAGIITKRTVKSGRKYRGRLYLPFVSEAAAHTDTTPTAAYLTAADAYALVTVAPITLVPAGVTGVFLTPLLKHAAVGTTADTITNYVVRDKWATQRRRGDYGRPNTQPFTG